MKQNRTTLGTLLSAVVLLLTCHPLEAADIEIKELQIKGKGRSGLELELKTEEKQTKNPQFILIRDGNTLIANILNTELKLPSGKNFQHHKPQRGISSLEVHKTDLSGIQIVIKGKNPLTGQFLTDEEGELILTVTPHKGRLPRLKFPTFLTQPLKSTTILSQATTGEEPMEIPIEPPQPQPISPVTSPDVLVPNPNIEIDGQQVPASSPLQPVAPAPAFLPRAVPPPVGDIAVGNINTAPEVIDMGTNAIVPRLVLREASVREVLSLLARSAGLNLVYTGSEADQGGDNSQFLTTISLDLENESVQDAFNTVLQVSGLQANRRGSTIFVGPSLPMAAKDLITRSFRLNQATAADASAFLGAQGAETQRVVTRTLTRTEGEGINQTTFTESETNIEPLGADEKEGPLLLRGMSVVTDERLNTITLVGTARQVEMGTAMLVQLDARKRQVAVNVKIIDINLLNTENFSTSFSFGIGDTFFSSDNGQLTVNQGRLTPPSSATTSGNSFGRPVVPNPLSGQQVFLDDALTPDENALLPTRPDTVDVTGSDETITTEQVPIDNTFLDFNGQPRQLQELIGFGGNVRPLTQSTTTGLVGADADPVTGAPRFFDINGEARLLSELVGFGGTLDPLVDFAVGDLIPATTEIISRVTDLEFTIPNFIQYPREFLAQVQAQVTNGNAKILTDPTLMVQEGQTASINLTQEVVGNIQSQTETSDGLTTRTISAEIEEAGLILELIVERIDDNGYINLAVNPTVTSIGATQDLSIGDDTNQIALLNVREINSGQIRLRDGQTLLMAGIIQDTDRTTVSKVPFLGDLPLLGALFRRTDRENSRQEVIILLTPQILDDSAESSFGYQYNPGSQTRQLLQQRGFNVPGAPR